MKCTARMLASYYHWSHLSFFSKRYLSLNLRKSSFLSGNIRCAYHNLCQDRIQCSSREFFANQNDIIIKNSIRRYSTTPKQGLKKEEATENEATVVKSGLEKKSSKSRLKQAVKEYGATTIVFHVGISLVSLGICYVAISNGVDAVRLLNFIGFSEAIISSRIAVEGSTFVISYAVHKLFAPVRIAITLSSVPFIVRYLRKIKFLK